MINVEVPDFNLHVLIGGVRWTKSVRISMAVALPEGEPTPRPVRVTANIQTHMRGIRDSFSDNESIQEHLQAYLRETIPGFVGAEVFIRS